MDRITKDNWYALLISGNEPRFTEGCIYFQNFLTNEAGFNSKNIKHIICTHHAKRHILEGTQKFINFAKEQTENPKILFLYNGHGGKGFVANNEEGFFTIKGYLSYSKWAKLIKNCEKYIFINESCYSGSLIKVFEKKRLLPDKGMVITSCTANELSHDNNFLNELIISYKNRKPFTNKEIYEHKIVGRIILTIPEGDTKDTISTAFFDQREELFDKPIILGEIQHPQKKGLLLDEILYSKNPEDNIKNLLIPQSINRIYL